jgi:hypothetical protein
MLLAALMKRYDCDGMRADAFPASFLRNMEWKVNAYYFIFASLVYLIYTAKDFCYPQCKINAGYEV